MIGETATTGTSSARNLSRILAIQEIAFGHDHIQVTKTLRAGVARDRSLIAMDAHPASGYVIFTNMMPK
jgi:hypothetical protein